MTARAAAYCEFIETPTFRRSAEGVLSDDELRALQHELVENPERGATIGGTGGLRKIRVALPGGGKSGGARVIYFVVGYRERIYLVLAYPKSMKADLSPAEKKRLRALAKELERED